MKYPSENFAKVVKGALGLGKLPERMKGKERTRTSYAHRAERKNVLVSLILQEDTQGGEK